jgi:hypothetical protein
MIGPTLIRRRCFALARAVTIGLVATVPTAVVLSLATFAAVTSLAAAATAANGWEPVPTPAVAVTLAAAAPASNDYPDADVIILHRGITIEIDADGRVTRRLHTVRKLLTHWAVRSRSDVRVVWDSSRQELDVATCRTVMRDGTVVTTPARGLNEVTPTAVARTAAFIDVREMVISHVGTEIGCVVELVYTITDQRPPPLPPSGMEFLQGPDPILYEEIVTVSAQPLVTAVPNGHAIAIVAHPAVSDAGQTRQRWEASDVPRVPTEGNAAHRGDYLPHVLYSTADDWVAVAGAWQRATQEAARTDSILSAWLIETPTATEPAALTPLDGVRRIAALVADGVRTVNLPTGPWSRRPRPAGEVYASACGTAWEKGVLAVTLLTEAGLQPELGFFTTYASFVDSVPAAVSFDRVRIVVAVAGDNYWLDPLRSDIWPGRCDLGGRHGLFLESQPNGLRTYRVANRRGESVLAIDIRPDETTDGGLTAVIDLSADGVLWTNTQDAEQVAEAVAKTVLHESEVTDLRTDQIGPFGIRVRIHARGSALADTEDGLLFYGLPAPPVAVTDRLPHAFDSAQRTRATPLFSGETCREELRLSITLPEGQTLDYAPAQLDLSSDHARYQLEIHPDTARVVLTRILEITPGRIEPDRYDSFRSVLNAALQPNAGLIVIRQE